MILVKKEGQALGDLKVQLANLEDLVILEHRVDLEMMADQAQQVFPALPVHKVPQDSVEPKDPWAIQVEMVLLVPLALEE